MRIAFISGMGGIPWGGSEVLWSQAALRLRAAGHAVFASVVSWPETPAPIRDLRHAGIAVNERKWVAASLPRKVLAGILHRPPKHPGWDAGWRQVVAFQPDLVCLSDGGVSCCLEWSNRCQAAAIPYVQVSQANAEQFWPDDALAPVLLAAHARACKTYFVSHGNLTLLEAQLAAQLPNAEVVRNPFNVSWQARPAWPLADGIFKLACVARLEAGVKGQDLLFQVLALDKWRARPLRVTLFGSGPNAVGLQRLAALYRLGERVHFAGQVADVEQIWQNHHALVLPSRYEGLPLAIVEAMLCGRLAIVTDVAGNKELLQDNVTGFVAAAPSVPLLDEAMERAWHRRADWQAIGHAAAVAIRKQVPADPAQVFADKLLAECEKLPLKSATSC